MRSGAQVDHHAIAVPGFEVLGLAVLRVVQDHAAAGDGALDVCAVDEVERVDATTADDVFDIHGNDHIAQQVNPAKPAGQFIQRFDPR